MKSFKINSQLFERESVLAIILLIPALVVIFGVLIFPLGTSLALSFTDLKLTNPDSGGFIGFRNFVEALKNPLFWSSIGRTTIFGVSTVLTEVFLGVAIALLLNQKFKGRGFARGVVILPWALPYVVNGIMWKWIFDANYGAFNAFLSQIGFLETYRIWLGEPISAFAIVVFANIWKETPVAVILVIAALQSIPHELYEAASIDGARSFRKFRSITFPMLKPIITTLVIIKTIWALKEFDLIYIITKGGPANSTNMFSYYIYQNTFKFLNFGYGSALAYLLTLLTIILAYFYMRSLKVGIDVES
ncbi:sugar ABC transporter permease [Sphaerochaeta halotolerans]|uniref:Sugar ABC transporter permease n=1 Tax=Sphaerochaeta halotolerans TaxID=2293840 RepID=A0A372MKJ3_9SPIR|nr:sugar ABC transporter permease [Sphaerochaeta halotolerans]RFU96292.1 sugar ABC transporter permease [Sphaerochaeta halotolerans]